MQLKEKDIKNIHIQRTNRKKNHLLYKGLRTKNVKNVRKSMFVFENDLTPFR